MSDYIKRDDAINMVRNTFTGMTADTLELRINDIPSADVAPVRHGRWIVKDGIIDCSVCNDAGWSVVPYRTLVEHFNYCPNCGAKMDLED